MIAWGRSESCAVASSRVHARPRHARPRSRAHAWRRCLLAVAAFLLLTRGGCRTYYSALYDYSPRGERSAFSIEPTRDGFALRPAGTTVLCNGALFIDERGQSHDVACSSRSVDGEMRREVWQSSLVNEANGGTITLVPADYVYDWPGHHPAVRFTPLLPVAQSPRKSTLSSNRVTVESLAREQVGKTIAIEVPVRVGGDVVRRRLEFSVTGFRVHRHPL